MSSAPEVVVDATKAAEEAAKMEDTAAAAAAAASQQANTDAAIAAAAAAAAVTAVEVAPATPTGDGIAQPRVSLLADVDGQGKRRFFPRVKHLIGNKEWEDFLTQVLQCIEEAGAPETAAASHKANNAWYKAFDLIYGGVAREYSIPTGKNRYHKFKDKILEVWVALEAQAPGENHCRELAMEQYDRYKRACAEANKNANGTPGGGALPGGLKIGKTGANQTPGSGYKLAGGKRSYSTAMGGGAPSPGMTASLWKNLDEGKVLEGLPVKLRELVHLKQLSKEMASGTSNRQARKAIEEHSKKLDTVYMEALNEYLKEDEDKEGESKDVEMSDNGDKAEAYNRCLATAFLYRYASTHIEQRILSEAYAKYTARCVTFKEPPEEAPAGVVDAAGATPAQTDEATAAAVAAAAMDDSYQVSI